jgi:predicted dithiol-disulfide oxidoreductase (DUF899 family)
VTSTDVISAFPPVVSRSEWQAARDALLVKEKAHTRAKDALSAERRRLPMVEVTTPYAFEGPTGPVTFAELFEGRQQLIVQHFMFGPDWEKGCPSCTATVNELASMATLHDKGITFALIARAPLPKLLAWRAAHGWQVPWYSSLGTTFNQDFGYTTAEGDERPGNSVFLRDGETVYHTYSTTGRGVEPLIYSFGFLDLTPYGRQETWEESPDGWPQTPFS